MIAHAVRYIAVMRKGVRRLYENALILAHRYSGRSLWDFQVSGILIEPSINILVI